MKQSITLLTFTVAGMLALSGCGSAEEETPTPSETITEEGAAPVLYLPNDYASVSHEPIEMTDLQEHDDKPFIKFDGGTLTVEESGRVEGVPLTASEYADLQEERATLGEDNVSDLPSMQVPEDGKVAYAFRVTLDEEPINIGGTPQFYVSEGDDEERGFNYYQDQVDPQAQKRYSVFNEGDNYIVVVADENADIKLIASLFGDEVDQVINLTTWQREDTLDMYYSNAGYEIDAPERYDLSGSYKSPQATFMYETELGDISRYVWLDEKGVASEDGSEVWLKIMINGEEIWEAKGDHGVHGLTNKFIVTDSDGKTYEETKEAGQIGVVMKVPADLTDFTFQMIATGESAGNTEINVTTPAQDMSF